MNAISFTSQTLTFIDILSTHKKNSTKCIAAVCIKPLTPEHYQLLKFPTLQEGQDLLTGQCAPKVR